MGLPYPDIKLLRDPAKGHTHVPRKVFVRDLDRVAMPRKLPNLLLPCDRFKSLVYRSLRIDIERAKCSARTIEGSS